jgi:hypothetical protein
MRASTLLILSLALPARAADAWPPDLPAPAVGAAVAAPRAGRPIDDGVAEPGLALLAKHDVLGLGAEAAAVERWRAGRKALVLVRVGNAAALSAGGGLELPVSAAMAAALENMNSCLATIAAANARPISPGELRAAILSTRGLAQIRGLFERMIEERLVLGGKMVMPEISGQATLEDSGVLTFHLTPDPIIPVIKSAAALRDDPKALAELYLRNADAMRVLDPQGAFKKFLFTTLPEWEARDWPKEAGRLNVLHVHVDAITELADGLSSGLPSANLATMAGTAWTGRQVGIWHTHPPYDAPGGWLPLAEEMAGPSGADLETAAKFGQNLTLAFLPDGFDAYDLSGPEAARGDTPAPLVRYRSADWRDRFQSVHDRLPRP